MTDTNTQLVEKLLAGFEAHQRRPDSYVIRETAGGDALATEGKGKRGKVIAEVLIRPKTGVRLNLARELPKGVPARLRKVVAPTRSAGQWALFAYVTDENLDAARELLQLVTARAT